MDGFSLPVGLITNVASVALGGLSGVALSKHIDDKLGDKLTLIFGVCALANGITSVNKATALSAIILAVIVGALIGETIHLDRLVTGFFKGVLNGLPTKKKDFDMAMYVTIAVIFCASGFGIYGVFMEGMSGDSSFLLSKSILDFFTAAIFAKTLGIAVCLIAVPQAVILVALLFLGHFIGPYITPDQMQNFIACGGVLAIASGFTIAKIKQFSMVNLLPALVLVIPTTWLYNAIFS